MAIWQVPDWEKRTSNGCKKDRNIWANPQITTSNRIWKVYMFSSKCKILTALSSVNNKGRSKNAPAHESNPRSLVLRDKHLNHSGYMPVFSVCFLVTQIPSAKYHNSILNHYMKLTNFKFKISKVDHDEFAPWSKWSQYKLQWVMNNKCEKQAWSSNQNVTYSLQQDFVKRNTVNMITYCNKTLVKNRV